MMVNSCLLRLEAWANGVPQGLVLGSLLFAIYLNNLDKNVHGLGSKFANDIKKGDIIDSEEGYKQL